jgi:outer membrane protein assembly factor BamE (lipoprotein component of BamABCDE complex)
MRTIVTLALAFMISACVTVGKEVTPDQLAGFKNGETTYDEVVAKLGKPTSTSYMSNGQRTLSYIFAHSQARPAAFIPVVGAFVGGADTRSSHAFFIFNRDGKLQDYRISSSDVGSGTGFAAGAYQKPNADQPQEAPKPAQP